MRLPVHAERSGVRSFPNDPSSANAGASGCFVINCTTPPSAELPYRFDAPPRTTSTLEIATRGIRSQYTHAPNGSTSEIPSASTNARLDALPPNPRNDTPCAEAFAVLLLDRRNSENPGTCRSMSSIRKAGVDVTSSDDSSTALPGVSASRTSARVADTITCCVTGDTSRTSSSVTAALPWLLQVRWTATNPCATTSRVPVPAGTFANEKPPLASLFADACHVPLCA